MPLAWHIEEMKTGLTPNLATLGLPPLQPNQVREGAAFSPVSPRHSARL
jgi:hypothetical protein